MAPQITPTKYPNSVSSFKKRFPTYAQQYPKDLNAALLSLSGSHWTIKHLEAFHVILHQGSDIFQILDKVSADATLSALDENLRANLELKFPSGRSINGATHKELRDLGGSFGSFYSQLRDVLYKNEPVNTRNADSKRNTIPITPSTRALSEQLNEEIGPETPSNHGSSQESDFTHPSAASTGQETQIDRAKDELLAVSLAAEFISCVLDLVSDQASDTVRVEFSREQKRFALAAKSGLKCGCIDDGCVVLRRKVGTRGWDTTHMCSLEAKRRFVNFQSDIHADDEGIISDDVLAQCFCEMLGKVMLNVEGVGQGGESPTTQGRKHPVFYLEEEDYHVFLISMHGHSMSFLHAEFSPEYLDQHVYISNHSQAAPTEPKYLEITKSQEYNLAKSDDRMSAAKVIVALCERFLKDHELDSDVASGSGSE